MIALRSTPSTVQVTSAAERGPQKNNNRRAITPKVRLQADPTNVRLKADPPDDGTTRIRTCYLPRCAAGGAAGSTGLGRTGGTIGGCGPSTFSSAACPHSSSPPDAPPTPSAPI